MAQPGRGRPPGPDNNIRWFAGVLLIIVVVLIGVIVLDHSNGRAPASTASTSRPSTAATTTTTVAGATTTTTTLPATQVKLQVLNGVLTGSLAGEWSAKLRASPGYQTLPPDNATARVHQSIIYVLTPGYVAEGQALAAVVGLPSSAVDTTIPPPASAPIPASERSTANLVLVIGDDLAASA